MAGERASLNARLEEQREVHAHAISQNQALNEQALSTHALRLRQEASTAANITLQAQLTQAMLLIDDLRRRVDAGSSPGTPRQADPVDIARASHVDYYEDVGAGGVGSLEVDQS